MSFCLECGSKNGPNTAFCSNCGKNLTTDNLGSPEQTNISNSDMPSTAIPFNSANANFLGIRPPKTTQLKWVQGFNWFNFVLFLLAGSLVILSGLFDNSIQGIAILIGFPLLFLAGITYLFIWGLSIVEEKIVKRKPRAANTEFLGLKLPKTTQLQIVQGLNWFYLIISLYLGMVNIILDEYQSFGVFLLMFSVVLFVIIRGLNNYINIIRLIWGVISIFIFVLSFIDFVSISFLLILISGYVAYTLFFHKPTVSLFK